MRHIVFLSTLFIAATAAAQTPDAGRQVFAQRCAGCHGSDGNGGELGPGIATRVPARTDQELTTSCVKVFRRPACRRSRI